MLRLVTASSPGHIEEVRRLFREYEQSLGISLCFQNFDEELQQLPGAYAEPEGSLLLAFEDDRPAACCALRKMGKAQPSPTAELKRLYVRPEFRGKGIARQLTKEILRRAVEKGYETVVLDTLKTMTEAQALYAAWGFREIPPYYSNPMEGTKYMKLDLREAGLLQ